MKRILSIIPVLILTLLLTSCGTKTEPISIEDYEWKMRAVMKNDIESAQNEDELVVAVGTDDELYPDAKIVDIVLTAKDEKISIVDNTNDKEYSGNYKLTDQTPKGCNYEITIDGNIGYATVSPTEYYDGTEIPTLPINIGEYSIYFIPVE